MPQATEEQRLKLLSSLTNRSLNQTKFLYHLCGQDFDFLMAAEVMLLDRYYFTPNNDKELKEAVLNLLNQKP